MHRYYMAVLVRDNDGGNSDLCEKGEIPLNCNVTAGSELEARRVALERAWFNGCLVSCFLQIQKGKPL